MDLSPRILVDATIFLLSLATAAACASSRDAEKSADGDAAPDAIASADGGADDSAKPDSATPADGGGPVPDALLDGVGPSPDHAAALAAYCVARCERAERCEEVEEIEDGPAACRAACAAELGARFARLRTDYLAAFTECVANLTCDEIDDGCGVTAARTIDPTPAAEAARDDCGAALGRCPGAVSVDLCAAVPVLTEEAVTAVAGCFDLPCESVGGCVDGALGD